MENGLTDLQQTAAEMDAVIAAPIIPTPREDVQTPLVLDHAFAQSAVVKPQSGREQTEQLMITKLSDEAVMPRKSSLNAAGFDLASSVDSVVPANGRALIPTDLAMVVPQGTYGRIAPRSGLAVKHFLSVGAGVIDADYRGNVKVLLFNHGDLDFHVSKGDRIA
jgi:dUTP pyrophosphatase